MRIGIEVSIDVTKIEKARIYEGKKGKYLHMTMFLDTEKESQYGDHGFVTHKLDKEERDQGVKSPILGNGKIFYVDEGQSQQPRATQQQPAPQQNQNTPRGYDDESDFPF
jgi:hypothetical protein